MRQERRMSFARRMPLLGLLLLSGQLLASCASPCGVIPSSEFVKVYSPEQDQELLNELEKLPPNTEIEIRLLDYKQLRDRLRSLQDG